MKEGIQNAMRETCVQMSPEHLVEFILLKTNSSSVSVTKTIITGRYCQFLLESIFGAKSHNIENIKQMFWRDLYGPHPSGDIGYQDMTQDLPTIAAKLYHESLWKIHF